MARQKVQKRRGKHGRRTIGHVLYTLLLAAEEEEKSPAEEKRPLHAAHCEQRGDGSVRVRVV